VDIALADKIATLQHARIPATRVRRRKLAHYDATLQLAVAAGANERLCRRVAELLDPKHVTLTRRTCGNALPRPCVRP
jgi:hypothetical protein